mmetsp:Transcript_84505/g.133479  ORF Transcript_84505/g.133479 Transcript_84505/m.133479 type:complete len:566 (-) Transcript_84505:152-1849(-)|eukprot:CAMPEP_0169097198 /NCGR_PEP_ID=MMETSP1015-20121227/19395_1 /TAXON_ID=342587 /ORGANISM="Karlodinium micrum, Strain CCMP2283" /LENGTH=565 /DNA_ID=CAMNT_0009157995 /DNA_START=119 /DNA_END=1816 /DNA_ORIENTATION=+
MGQTSSLGSSCTRDSRLADGQIDVYAKASRHEVLEEVCTPYDDDLDQPQPQQVLLDIQRKEVAEADIEPATVILHIYDINATMAVANKVLAFSGKDIALGGAFHTGLEAYGSEWSYGSAGVTSIPPRTADHVYRCSMVLGQTTLIQWVAELHDMCQTWRGQDYQLLGGYNCNTFVAELANRLGVGPVPGWVDRFSRIAGKGRETGKRVFRAASEARSRFVTGDREKIVAELDPHTHRADDVELRLPQSQLYVRGQKVALENSPKRAREGIQSRSRAEQINSLDSPRDTAQAPLYVTSRRGQAVQKERSVTEDTLSDSIQYSRSHSQHSRRSASRGSLPRCDAWNTANGDMVGTQRMPMPHLQRCGSVDTNAPADYERPVQTCKHTIGSAVEYFSTTHNTWIPTQVLDFDGDRGLYDLTCKGQVPPQKIRTPQLETVREKPRNENRPTVPATKRSDTSWFPPGHSVEYESASAEGCWIPAVVVAYYADTGLYDLDCKAQAPREKIRPVEDFPINADVEYRSTSAGQNLGWIPGVVLAFDEASGLYDLSCKGKVPRAQIQFPKRDNV